MAKRVASSVVGILIFLGLCYWGPLPWAIGATIVAALAAHEFIAAYRAHLQSTTGSPGAPMNAALVIVSVFMPLVTFLLNRQGRDAATLYALGLAFLVGIFSFTVPHYIRTGRALGRLLGWYGLVGAGYIGLLFSGLVLLRCIPGWVTVAPFHRADFGAWISLYVAACVWMSDILALFGGKALGKHKLAPTLSPGKTSEGLVSGVLGALVTGLLFGWWIHIPLLHGAAIGAIAGIVGPLGDLYESALKRELGIKDFGSIMPGHGGTLDRFDSLLFVMPIAYLYLRLIAGI